MSGKPAPKRLCRDPHTKYCFGKWKHRGCCNCWEANHQPFEANIWKCAPYYMTEYWIESFPDDVDSR